RIIAAGQPHGLRLFGMRALMSLRLEKSYGTWFREYRPIYTPAEGGITRYLKLDHEFVGRAAHEQELAEGGPKRRLVAFVIDPQPDDPADVIAYVRTCQVAARPGTVVVRHPADGNPPLPRVDGGDLTRSPIGRDISVRRLETELAVIGGGPAGRRTADAAREAGRSVLILDAADGIEVMGLYPGPSIVAREPGGMLHVAAAEVVVATGASEIQPVCPGHDLAQAWDKGYTELELLKRASWAGLGPCQGGACLPHVRAFIAARTGTVPEPFTARPASRQITLGEAAADVAIDAFRRTPLHAE